MRPPNRRNRVRPRPGSAGTPALTGADTAPVASGQGFSLKIPDDTAHGSPPDRDAIRALAVEIVIRHMPGWRDEIARAGEQAKIPSGPAGLERWVLIVGIEVQFRCGERLEPLVQQPALTLGDLINGVQRLWEHA